MSQLSSILKLDSWIDSNRYAGAVVWLRRGVGAFIILNTLLLLPIHDMIWGSDAVLGYQETPGGWLRAPFFLLLREGWQNYYPVFIIGQLVFALLLMVGKWPQLAALLTFWFSKNLFNAYFELQNGGDQLILLMCFYLIFMSSNRKEPATTKDHLKVLISNLAVAAARWQIVLMYAFAGFYKLQGETWLSGEALGLLFGLPDYNLPWLTDWLADIPILVKAGTYFALGYQLVFPFLIWWNRLRGPVLLMGTLFHLGIIFVVGLPGFGLAVLSAYLIFLSPGKAIRWEQKRKALFGFFRRRGALQ